jgi:hypothetical protein
MAFMHKVNSVFTSFLSFHVLRARTNACLIKVIQNYLSWIQQIIFLKHGENESLVWTRDLSSSVHQYSGKQHVFMSVTYLLILVPFKVCYQWLIQKMTFDDRRYRHGQWLLHNHKVVVCDTKSMHIGRMKWPSGWYWAYYTGLFKRTLPLTGTPITWLWYKN